VITPSETRIFLVIIVIVTYILNFDATSLTCFRIRIEGAFPLSLLYS